MFEPMLYKIAIPIFANKNIGAIYESNASSRTIKQRATAINTYTTISESDKSLVSTTVADIPLILH